LRRCDGRHCAPARAPLRSPQDKRRTGAHSKKTPTAEPQPQKNSYDISTWLSVALAILLLVKLGVVVSRHI
jgi:hypothetical protein